MNPFDRLRELGDENQGVKWGMDAERGRFDALRSRHEDGTAPRAITAFNLFQTPVVIAERLAKLLNIGAEDRILEPSAGLGRIFCAVQAFKPAEIVLVEQSADCCKELYGMTIDAPGVQLLQRDFLTVEGLEPFNKIAMNPPFKMRSDVEHIKHALTMLKPGGVLAGLCMAGPIREREIMPLCDTWEPLPVHTFKESGTKTETVLFTIRKD